MNKILIIMFAVFALVSSSFAENKDIQIKLVPDKVSDQKPDEKSSFIIKSNKTGEEWNFSAKEMLKIYKSVNNWDTVESTDPIIKDVYEDSNYLYIVFGYFSKENKEFMGIKLSKKDKSVLSGKILIHKKYLVNESMTKCNVTFWKGAAMGIGIYSILITICFLITIL